MHAHVWPNGAIIALLSGLAISLTAVAADSPPAHYGPNITLTECKGLGREGELALLHKGKWRPYVFLGPPHQCTVRGCKHGYWAKLARFQKTQGFTPCKPELRQRLLAWLMDQAQRLDSTWAQDALLLRPCQLWERLRGRTLWAIGDSMSKEFQYALVMLLVEYHADESEQRRPISTDDNILQVLREDAVGNEDAEADCTDLAEGTRVCFVRAMKVPRFLRITPVLPRIVGSDDVVLLNFGLHYNMMDELRRDMEQLSAILPRLIEQIGATLIWRETTPQHFNTPTGSYILDSSPASDICRPVGSFAGIEVTVAADGSLGPAPGAALPEPGSQAGNTLASILGGGPRNAVSQPAIDALALPTLAVWNRTVPLHELHQEPQDCSHFCAPGWGQLHASELLKLLDTVLPPQQPQPLVDSMRRRGRRRMASVPANARLIR